MCGKAWRDHADGLRYGTGHMRNWPLKFKAGIARNPWAIG